MYCLRMKYDLPKNTELGKQRSHISKLMSIMISE